MKTLRITLSFFFILAMISPSSYAKKGNGSNSTVPAKDIVKGAVSKIDAAARRITVGGTSFSISASTDVIINGAKAAFEDIKEGMRVTVTPKATSKSAANIVEVTSEGKKDDKKK